MKNIILNIHGPFRLLTKDDLFKHESINQPGIYFWTVKLNDTYLINYIGISSKSIKYRLIEHIKLFLSGGYDIYEQNNFENGILERIYVPGDDYTKFLDNLENNLLIALKNLRTLDFFFSPLYESKYLLEIIESEMIKSIKGSDDHTKKFLSNYKLSRLKTEQLDIEISFVSESLIHGLNNNLLL